jgi:hypothetical protein
MADSFRLEELKRRVQQDPASIAFAALADEYRRAGLFREAIDTCRAGLRRHPAYLSARVTLGRALIEVGEYDEAQEHLEQVVRMAPDNLAAIRALADLHERRTGVHEAPADHPTEPRAAGPEPRVEGRVVPMAPRASAPVDVPAPRMDTPAAAASTSTIKLAASRPTPPAVQTPIATPPAPPAAATHTVTPEAAASGETPAPAVPAATIRLAPIAPAAPMAPEARLVRETPVTPQARVAPEPVETRVVPAVPEVPLAPVRDPALDRLEHFLAAIARARSRSPADGAQADRH